MKSAKSTAIPNKEILQIRMISADTKLEDSKSFVSWKIKSITSQGIKIQVEFDEPLEVSTGEEFDYFEVIIDLSTYTDSKGTSFPN